MTIDRSNSTVSRENRSQSFTEPRRMVSHSSDMILSNILTKYQSDVNFKISFQISSKQTNSQIKSPEFQKFLILPRAFHKYYEMLKILDFRNLKICHVKFFLSIWAISG